MYRIIVLVQHYPLFICSTIQIYNNPVSLMGNKGYLWFEKYPCIGISLESRSSYATFNGTEYANME
jgi:hypothetical protein